MAYLVITDGEGERTHEIKDALTVLGRSPESQVRIIDTKCSRRHCEIHRTDQGYKLVDLESSNGTRVNNELVNQKLLSPGDTVQIGKSRIVYREGVPGGPIPQPAPLPLEQKAPVAARSPRAGRYYEPRGDKERKMLQAIGVGLGIFLGLMALLFVFQSSMTRRAAAPEKIPVKTVEAPAKATPPEPAPTKAAAPDSEFSDLKERVNDSIRKGRFIEAIRLADQIAEKFKGDPKAMEARNEVLRSVNEFADSQRQRVKDLREKGQDEEAQAILTEAIKKLSGESAFVVQVELLKQDGR